MRKIRKKRGLLGILMIAAILGTGCNTEQSVPELYVDDNIRETPVTVFTENAEVSAAIEERCKAVLNQDESTNITVTVILPIIMQRRDYHTGSFF